MKTSIKLRPEEVAQQLVERFGTTLPINISAIAQGYNIDIHSQALDDSVSGLLVIKGDRAVIAVNEQHHPNRQRFTIAHELGHYFLHQEAANVFIDASAVFFRDEVSGEGIQRQEIEANTFAAELLMPAALLRQHIIRAPLDAFDDIAVRRLATQFNVSVQALTIRLTKLGLITA